LIDIYGLRPGGALPIDPSKPAIFGNVPAAQPNNKWSADTPSSPECVWRAICKYMKVANGVGKNAEGKADWDRGTRTQLANGKANPTGGYDLCLRDAEHFLLGYSNPLLGGPIITGYSVAKALGFDHPNASSPTWSEVYWGTLGAQYGGYGMELPCKECSKDYGKY
jgi:hypothetical protein